MPFSIPCSRSILHRNCCVKFFCDLISITWSEIWTKWTFMNKAVSSSSFWLIYFFGCIFLILFIYFFFSIGPNLNGLFGRQSGTTAGYSYSNANKSMAVIWEDNTLYDYLLNPKKVWFLDLSAAWYSELCEYFGVEVSCVCSL